MEFCVVKCVPAERRQVASLDGVSWSLDRKSAPSLMFATEQAACIHARQLAEKEPESLFMVMQPVVVIEARPRKVDHIVKKYNDAGELVAI